MSLQSDLESYLQDVSDVSGILLGKLLQGEAEVTDDAAGDAKDMLGKLKEMLPLLEEANTLWGVERRESVEDVKRELSPVYL